MAKDKREKCETIEEIKIPALGVGLKLGGADIVQQAKRSTSAESDMVELLQEQTRKKAEDDAKSIAIPLVPPMPEGGLTSEEPSVESELLGEALQLISSKKYLEAIPLLQQYLEKEPEHCLARYSLAYCFSKTDQHWETITELNHLRNRQLEASLAPKIDALRNLTRSALIPEVLLELVRAKARNRYESVIEKSRALVELDPEAIPFHFCLSAALMESGLLKEAREAARRGKKIAGDGPDSVMIEMILTETCSRLCRHAMEPARDAFRQKKYRAALSSLKSANSTCEDVPLYSVFTNYTGRLAGPRFRLGSRPTLEECVISGDPREVDELCFFLVSDEVREAQQHLNAGDLQRARTALERALSICPSFPYANLLLASCTFSLLAGESDKPPSQDTVISTLERVLECARIGQRDHDLGHEASKLAEMVEKQLEMFEAAKSDAELVNGLIGEFNQIMESAKPDGSKPPNLAKLEDRLKALQKRIKHAKNKVKVDEGRKVLGRLSSATDNAIRDIGPAQELAELADQLGSILGRVKETLSAGEGVSKLIGELRAHKRKIAQFRNRLDNDDAKKQVNQLVKVVDGHIEQLESVGALGPFVKEMGLIVEGVNKGYVDRAAARLALHNLLERIQASGLPWDSPVVKGLLMKIQELLGQLG